MGNKCGPCWEGKHKCKQTAAGRCRACNNYLDRRQIVNQGSITYAPDFYNANMFHQLFRNYPAGSLSSLSTEGLDSSTFSLQISTSTGWVIDSSEDIRGPFTTQNKVVMAWLDGLARQFSAELKAKEGECNLIPTSALLGGYTFLLCSITGVTEQASTIRDGYPIENEYNGYNLEVHFKCVLICRIQELLNEILNAARIEDPGNMLSYWCSNAHAAAVIARTELHYFKGNIRNGSLRDNMCSGVKSYIYDWLESADRELMDRICEGCGRYPGWKTSIIMGSLKKMRRHGETLTAAMHIQLNKHTMPSLAYDPQLSYYPYTTIGNGENTLPTMPPLSRPTSANAARYLSPAANSAQSEFTRYSPAVPVPEIDSPQGLQMSSAYGENHAGHMSNQPLESANSRRFDDLTYLDLEYLSDNWYPGQCPLSDGL